MIPGIQVEFRTPISDAKGQMSQVWQRRFANLFEQAITFVPVPKTATSLGLPGQVAYDLSHFYVCVKANTWVRTALVTW